MTTAQKHLPVRGVKAPFPEALAPMLCTLTRQPVTDEDYIHEMKFDGYRILAYKNKNKVLLSSRSGLNYTSKYPSVEHAFAKLKASCVLDGEVCALNAAGHPDFDTLQKPPAGTPLVYYAFDILWLDGYNLMGLPLIARKKVLQQLLKGNDVLRYSEHFDDANALYAQMQSMGMEGIVSKRQDSVYVPGQRGSNWYKTPTEMRQEYVIGGWVESDKGRPFASLLFGAYKNKKLEWVGHAGGGFKHKDMPGILARMKKLEVQTKPFSTPVDYKGVVHWVKPEIVANFKFATFTKSGRIRKPAIFLGFREDKAAAKVVQEVAIATPKKEKTTKPLTIKLPAASPGSNWHAIEKQPVTHSAQIMIGECSFIATDIEREIWKGVSKMQLIQYYHNVCPLIMPHLANRPQSLHVKPINANAPGMYIKDMEGREPECATIFSDKRKHSKAGKRAMIDYLVCNNEATLLYMVNLGCVDINPWTSRISSPTEPDYIIIDLDPSDNDFKKAISAAEVTKQILDEAGLTSFVKTSGKTGIHIYLPCRGFTFPQARTIAQHFCSRIQKLLPTITTTNISVSSRGDKLYLDPNQNDYAGTVAAPYAARSHHIPTVSTPLDWKEVNAKLDPSAFTISTILKRIDRRGDLFAKVHDEKIARKNSKKLIEYL